MHSLSYFMTGTDNNLNFIRALAAFMVLFAHSYALSGVNGPTLLFSKISFGSWLLIFSFSSAGY